MAPKTKNEATRTAHSFAVEMTSCSGYTSLEEGIKKMLVSVEEEFSKDQSPLPSIDFTTKKKKPGKSPSSAPFKPSGGFHLSFSSKLLRHPSTQGQTAVTAVPKNSGGIQVSNGAKLLGSMSVRGTKACKKFCVASAHRTGVSSLGLLQSAGMLGIKRWTTFPRGQRKRERGRQGKEGLGRKWERERERERECREEGK